VVGVVVPEPAQSPLINDVVIAGAGPNGLILACELSLAGARPIVLERLAEPGAEPRANGLVGQVVRILDRRGLYERIADGAQPPQPAPAFMFAAMRLGLASIEDGNPLYVLPVRQARLTQVLADRAAELGVQVRRGHELTGLAQDDDAVTAEVAGPDGTYRLRASYLVGADGGRSVTRKLSGIAFPGVTRDDTVSRTLHATPPADWIDPRTGALNVPGYGPIPPHLHHRTENGLFVYAPFPGRPATLLTHECGSPEDTATPLDLAEMEKSIGRVLGADVPLTAPTGDGPHLARRLVGTNTRLAERYRDRRVLLVGDAAHVHPPAGGPGLNLGLQDAVNLGWKLAAAVQDDDRAGLLDTYEAERRPAGQRVIMQTQAQSALTAPGPEVTALRELFGELLTDPRNIKHIAATMAGSDVRYETGDHPLVGFFAPDIELAVDLDLAADPRTATHAASGPVRLAELTRNARPLLIDMTEHGLAVDGPWDVVRAQARRASDAPSHEPSHASALLLRPDTYVAWASSSASPDAEELDALRAVADRWFGGAGRSDKSGRSVGVLVDAEHE
jgi:2-polyprenyl-6-methoxyphenol hydroxylase-like FAD-dependent oxidoreductase